MSPKLLAALLGGTLSLGAANAEEVELQPTVQVTASRVAETVDETLADVSIILRDDIEASVARDVPELLRLMAGVDLYRTGGPGAQTSIFLRGSNSNQVLVLIDGVRAGAATTGAYAFEHLPLGAVERIEIVRGPRASYWGSDAIGGVIQIFTRRLDAPRVALGYGSAEDAAGSAGFGRWDGANGFSAQVGARHVDGISSTNAGICNGPDDPWCIFDPDEDSYRSTNLVLRGARSLGGQLLSAMFFHTRARVDFDQGFTDVIQQVAGADLEGELAANWQHRLALGHAREDLDTPAFGSRYHTRRKSLLWQNEFRLAGNQRLVAGFDFVHERGETLDTFANLPRYHQNRDNRALFAGWRGRFAALDGEVSMRRDDNSVFGGATTGSLALGWRATESLRLRANLGQGFRSPTMNELYDPGYGGWFAGNPGLKPERSVASELALEWQPAAEQRFGASAYSNRIYQLVSFTGPQNQAENIAHARVEGVELGYRGNFGAWTASANYTYEDAKDSDAGTPLLRRARHKFTGIVEHRFGSRLDAGAELVASSSRHDVGGIELGGYALLNLRLRYDLAPAWQLRMRLENLADRRYELVHGYNTPGRSAFLEIAWQPSS